MQSIVPARRVRALSAWGLSQCGDTLSPALSRKRERERTFFGALLCLSLNRRHIVVREAEMVADLVDQDVADDMAEAFVVLGPIV